MVLCFALFFLIGLVSVLLLRGYSVADLWRRTDGGPNADGNGAADPPAWVLDPGEVILVPRSAPDPGQVELEIPDPPVTVRQVPPGQDKVALTFDSGWIYEPTHALLDVLSDYDLQVTFFPRAKWIEDHPELIARILDDGHEVGSHSYTHPDLTKLDRDGMDREIRLAKEALIAAGGQEAFVPFYRPPYGAHSAAVSEVLAEYGYGWIVMWQVDSLDWREPGVDAIVQRVLDRVTDGGIVLLHVGSWQTIEALPVIIETLFERGLAIVRVSELLGLRLRPDTGPLDYLVAEGETLEQIAAAHRTTVAALLELNPRIRR